MTHPKTAAELPLDEAVEVYIQNREKLARIEGARLALKNGAKSLIAYRDKNFTNMDEMFGLSCAVKHLRALSPETTNESSPCES